MDAAAGHLWAEGDPSPQRGPKYIEALKGNRQGQHSIRINDQWRICFDWREDGVYEVEIVDYH